jgi:hypothetical protein
MVSSRKSEGFKLFKQLLADRGTHYKTEYKLLIDQSAYERKYVKYPFKCTAHGKILKYSMFDLNFMTSCPCPDCRIDPLHKNS